MKIAIISDSHDNLATLKIALAWIKKEKIKVIIHCGDVSKEEFLKEALADYGGRIFLSRGNCDIDSFKSVPKIKVFDDFGQVKLAGKKIAFCHFPPTAEILAQKNCYDAVFYGHNHKPWVNKVGKTKLANPGNLAGVFYKATLAVYDTKIDKLELKILERL
jgi:uncharacterized protein